MRNKLLLSLFTAGALGIGAQASLASIEGLTASKIDCDNGQKGYTIEIKKDSVENTINYNSCTDGSLVVKDSEGNVVSGGGSIGGGSIGETINIDGTDYFFPDGYTELTKVAGNSCQTGFENGHNTFISCGSGGLIGVLDDGYLNSVILPDAQFHNNSLTNIDSLSNVTEAQSLTFENNDLTEVNGLKNLQYAKLLSLSNNPLENIDGLKNLENIDSSLNIYSTNITNLNGLNKLKSVKSYISLDSNPLLTDISGLNNLEEVNSIYFDDRNYETKLSSTSYICQNFSVVKIPTNKSYVCEE